MSRSGMVCLCRRRPLVPSSNGLRAAPGVGAKDEGNRARFLALGMEPVLDTPEEFSAIVKTQQEKDSALVKELDLKTQ